MLVAVCKLSGSGEEAALKALAAIPEGVLENHTASHLRKGEESTLWNAEGTAPGQNPLWNAEGTAPNQHPLWNPEGIAPGQHVVIMSSILETVLAQDSVRHNSQKTLLCMLPE